MGLFRGLQFNVAYEGEQVVKTPKKPWEIACTLLLWEPWRILTLHALHDKISKVVAERDEVLAELQRRHIDSVLIANAQIGDVITQDLCLPLDEVLQRNSHAIIDSFIALQHDFWRNGFAESTYNLTLNYGLDNEGRVVLLDIGELVFEKDAVREHIETKRWLTSFSYVNPLLGMPRGLRKYYREQMDKHMTLQNLDTYWRHK